MSEFLDELARTLAQPMPRRRMVRLFAGAVGAALPGGRAAVALASSTVTCNPKKELKCFCPSKNGLFFKLCCPNDGTYKCDCFSDRAQCTKLHKCPTGKRACGDRCCDLNQECVSFSVRGTTQYICSDKCPPGQAACGGDVCCPKGQNCLDPVKHICGICPPGQFKCGKRCCKRGGTCCDSKKGLCCKPGEKCGSWPPNKRICCKQHSCQERPGDEPFCCQSADEVCVPQLAPGASGFTGSSPRVCCPPERQVSGGSDVVSCCPPGEVAAPGGKLIVGAGLSGVCCPSGSICGTGSDATCCPTGTTCCDGQCFDLSTDPANCGSCGHACTANAVCRDGQCAVAG